MAYVNSIFTSLWSVCAHSAIRRIGIKLLCYLQIVMAKVLPI